MLVRGGNMIATYEMLKQSLKGYKAKDMKIKRMVDCGEIVRLTRNLYETDPSIPGHLVANAIYSPSYLSFDYALAFYDLIPERVYVYTSATYDKKKTKMYKNKLGIFTYRDVPKHIYPYGIQLFKENDYYYAIATPQKAICDKLYTVNPVSNKEEMYNLLFNDLRIDIDELMQLDFRDFYILCDHYRSTNMKILRKVLGDIHENNN